MLHVLALQSSIYYYNEQIAEDMQGKGRRNLGRWMSIAVIAVSVAWIAKVWINPSRQTIPSTPGQQLLQITSVMLVSSTPLQLVRRIEATGILCLTCQPIPLLITIWVLSLSKLESSAWNDQKYKLLSALHPYHLTHTSITFVNDYLPHDADIKYTLRHLQINRISNMFIAKQASDDSQQQPWRQLVVMINEQAGWNVVEYDQFVHAYANKSMEQSHSQTCPLKFGQLLHASGVQQLYKNRRELYMSMQPKQLQQIRQVFSLQITALGSHLHLQQPSVATPIFIPSLQFSNSHRPITEILLKLALRWPHSTQIAVPNLDWFTLLRRNFVINDLDLMHEDKSVITQYQGQIQTEPGVQLNLLNEVISSIDNVKTTNKQEIGYRMRIIKHSIKVIVYVRESGLAEQDGLSRLRAEFSMTKLKLRQKTTNSHNAQEIAGFYLLTKKQKAAQQISVSEHRQLPQLGYQFAATASPTIIQILQPAWTIKHSRQTSIQVPPCLRQNPPSFMDYLPALSAHLDQYQNATQIVTRATASDSTSILWCIGHQQLLFFMLGVHQNVQRICLCSQIEAVVTKKLVKIAVLNDFMGKLDIVVKDKQPCQVKIVDQQYSTNIEECTDLHTTFIHNSKSCEFQSIDGFCVQLSSQQ